MPAVIFLFGWIAVVCINILQTNNLFIKKPKSEGEMRRMCLFLVILVHLSIISNSYAQGEEPVKKQHKIGFNYGYGSQFAINVNYTYKVRLFQLQYYYPLLTRKNVSLEFTSQPQFNLSYYNDTPNSATFYRGYEFGLNEGFLARRYFLKKSMSLYSLLGTGPHYVSGVPERQTPGFIFADYLYLGTSIKVTKKAFLDFRAGIRHISNAKLRLPNGGINNFVTNIGFYVPLN